MGLAKRGRIDVLPTVEWRISGEHGTRTIFIYTAERIGQPLASLRHWAVKHGVAILDVYRNGSVS